MNLRVGAAKRAFYELSEFPELVRLASQHATITAELHENGSWLDWGSDNYDASGHCNFLSGDWTVCPVYFGNYGPELLNVPAARRGALEALARSLPTKFPETTQLLKQVESVNFSGISKLHPKSNLAPHQHENPYSLIFHLGLVIPPGETCGLSVGPSTHIWRAPGDAVVFNDTLPHSAWNHSDQERLILYVDFSY